MAEIFIRGFPFPSHKIGERMLLCSDIKPLKLIYCTTEYDLPSGVFSLVSPWPSLIAISGRLPVNPIENRASVVATVNGEGLRYGSLYYYGDSCILTMSISVMKSSHLAATACAILSNAIFEQVNQRVIRRLRHKTKA